MAKRLSCVLASAGAIFLGCAGSAAAARVTTHPVCELSGTGACYMRVPEAVFIAAGGEQNDLTILREDGRFVFRDSVPVEAGPGCESRSPVEVACESKYAIVHLGDGTDTATAAFGAGEIFPASLTSVDAGDGADRVVVPAAKVTGGEGDDELTGGSAVDGGPGDDTLTGGEVTGGRGRDVITGTEASNRLTGGPDADELRGGGGNDTLTGDGRPAYDRPAEPAADVLDGGPGLDTAAYEAHRPPVTVDIAAQRGGAEGEGDLLREVEAASGGLGADRLLGDDGPNVLDGDGGNDSVVGGAGDDRLGGGSSDDRLDGGPGADGLYGGNGSDTLEGRDGDDRLDGGYEFDRVLGGDGDDRASGAEGGSDLIECGAGLDVVEYPEKSHFQRDCEFVELHFSVPDIRPFPSVRSDGRLVFKFTCQRLKACDGKLALRLLGGPIDPFVTRRWSADRGRARVVVSVPRSIRERRGPVRIVVSLSGLLRKKPLDVHPAFGGRWTIDLPRTPR